MYGRSRYPLLSVVIASSEGLEENFKAGMARAFEDFFFYYFRASLSFYLNGNGDEIDGVILNILILWLLGVDGLKGVL
jgi:hypothetical protein